MKLKLTIITYSVRDQSFFFSATSQPKSSKLVNQMTIHSIYFVRKIEKIRQDRNEFQEIRKQIWINSKHLNSTKKNHRFSKFNEFMYVLKKRHKQTIKITETQAALIMLLLSYSVEMSLNGIEFPCAKLTQILYNLQFLCERFRFNAHRLR